MEGKDGGLVVTGVRRLEELRNLVLVVVSSRRIVCGVYDNMSVEIIKKSHNRITKMRFVPHQN